MFDEEVMKMKKNTPVKLLVSKQDDDFLNNEMLTMNKFIKTPGGEIREVEWSKPAIIRVILSECLLVLSDLEDVENGTKKEEYDGHWDKEKLNILKKTFDIKKISRGRDNCRIDIYREKINIPITVTLSGIILEMMEKQIESIKNKLELDISRSDFIRFCIRSSRDLKSQNKQ